jgi:dihydroorotase
MDREAVSLLIRNVRLVDPGRGVDLPATDLLVVDGVLESTERTSDLHNIEVLDFTGMSVVAMPPAIDLHVHFRDPGNLEAEDITSGSAAALAGGFGHVVMMANTSPVIDTGEAVATQRDNGASAMVKVDTVCALTKNLEGQALVDVPACTDAGAVAFTDDGRNLATPEVALAGLKATAAQNRPLLVHAEDEVMIAGLGRRSSAAEESAISRWITLLTEVPTARLHIQHISTAAGLRLVESAKDRGLAVTCEVTPHHLALTQPEEPTQLHKVNPPLRTADDVEALRQGLRDGVIDAIATDHAPHSREAKSKPFAEAPSGMIGLELAWPLLTQAGFSGAELAIAVAALTVGPAKILGIGAPSLGDKTRASLVLLNLGDSWTVDGTTLRSGSYNTPLLGQKVRSKIALNVLDGKVVYSDPLIMLRGAAASV